MFQIGFLEIIFILVVGLFVIGPSRLPTVIKFVIKIYKRIQKQVSKFKNDLEAEIGTEEIKKDVFNEMRMEELDLNGDKNKSD
ncbi:MAG: Sec-independent protein translocase protein TatB [Gammaproteobacteria bacterium]|uniref:Twin-arginine translocase subunit TatB n=1 Tax=SAR86 cluster bacterium TaxID=2030880 RepID=A0A838YS51_9GAMM|nr:twin-arginine translocase subunit TatB [SAR86 cluster bacterium]